MTTFHVDPDIRKAETLPAEFYTRDDVFAASKDRVFAKSWQWVGHAPTAASPERFRCARDDCSAA